MTFVRLSVQWALFVAGVVTLTLVVHGVFSTRIALAEASAARDAVLRRDAERIAAYIDTWLIGQRDALAGWTVPFRVEGDTELQQNLLRAILLAVPSVRSARWEESPASSVVDGGFGALTLSEEGDTRLELVVGGPGAVGQALRAELDLGVVQAMLDDDASGDRTVLLVGDDGAAIGHGKGATSLDVDVVERLARAASSGTFDVRMPDGGASRGALARVESTGWTVAILEPARAAAAASDGILRRTGWVGLVSAAMATALALIFSRSMLDSVSALREAAHAVAQGELGRRVEIFRRDELGELAEAFNRMSDALLANRSEITQQKDAIEKFNRELQERVEQRTRELEAAQARLVQSGRLVAAAEIGAGLAHELNNPLAAVLGLAQVLRAHASEPQAKLLTKIEEQTQRCREVVSAMMRHASADADAFEACATDLRPLLDEVEAVVVGAFRQRGVALELRVPTAPMVAWVEAQRASRTLAQVLLALCSACEAGTRLVVDAETGDARSAIRLTLDRDAAADAQDERRAAGMAWWFARRMVDQLGGRFVEVVPRRVWQVSFPLGGA